MQGTGVRRRHAPPVQRQRVSVEHEYRAYEEDDDDKPEYPAPATYSYIDTAWSALAWLYGCIPSWQSFSQLLLGAPRQPFVIPPEMQDRVDHFKEYISVPYSDDDEDHVQVLREYWELCFPGEPFQRKTKRWQDAGFQSDDPGRDFRGAGIYGLRHLVYFASTRRTEFVRCMRSGYPFSIAGLNVSMLLYQLMGWGFKKREPMPEMFHLLFGAVDNGSRFEELYCRALLMLDAEWHRTNATYMQFPLVLSATEANVVASIQQEARAKK